MNYIQIVKFQRLPIHQSFFSNELGSSISGLKASSTKIYFISFKNLWAQLAMVSIMGIVVAFLLFAEWYFNSNRPA